jgi:hypothetical protein
MDRSVQPISRIRSPSAPPQLVAKVWRQGIERGDVPVAGADGPRVEREIGQIALQQRPAEVSEAGCGDIGPGQETGEPGERKKVDDDLVDAAADAQPPAGEPFSQIPEPLLGDAVEPQARLAFYPQPPQLPDITGELRLPAGPGLQILDVSVRVAQEGKRSAASREPRGSHGTYARPAHRTSVVGSGYQARPVL